MFSQFRGVISVEVIVYSTTSCPWCTKAKDFLTSLNVPYEVKDLNGDKAAAMFVVKKTHQMGVPVVQVGDTFIVGFNPEKITETLKEAKII